MPLPSPGTLSRRSLLLASSGLLLLGGSGCAELLPGTKVAPDFFAMITDTTWLPVSDNPIGEAGRLITPASGVQVTSVSTINSLSTIATSALQGEYEGKLAPPDGHAFMVVSLEAVTPGFFDLDTPNLTVVAGEHTHDLGHPFGAFLRRRMEWETETCAFCLCVPKEGPVHLAVTDQGKTAKIDLRAGARTSEPDTVANDGFLSRSDVVPPDTPVVWKATALSEPGEEYRRDPGDLTLTWTFDKDYTWVAPFAGKWAKPGHQWIGLGIKSSAVWKGQEFALNSTSAKSFTLVDSKGGQHVGDSEELDLFGSSDEPWVVCFEVPTGVESGEVHVKFDGELIALYRDGNTPARFLRKDKELVFTLKAL